MRGKDSKTVPLHAVFFNFFASTLRTRIFKTKDNDLHHGKRWWVPSLRLSLAISDEHPLLLSSVSEHWVKNLTITVLFFLFLPLRSLLYRLAREGEKRVRWHEAHVKSCRMTRAGLKGTSMFLCCMTFQFRIFSTSFFFTKNWSQFRMAASRRTLIENGKDPSNKRRKHNKQKTMRHLIIRAL